jgi:hypothetical protein
MPVCQKKGVAEITIWKCMKRKNEDERVTGGGYVPEWEEYPPHRRRFLK